MKTSPRTRKILYSALTVLVVLVVLEAAASWLMLVHYRAAHVRDFEFHDPSYSSLVNLARRFGQTVGLSDPPVVLEETSPSPFFRADPLLGYSAAPGVYTQSYSRPSPITGQYLRNRVTIDADGSRWTGVPRPGRPTVYVFGDSWVFGNGVPDELTFASHLHQALPDWNVRLLALGGWSLTQAVLNFDRLKDIGPNDVIILGYAGYYDVRHVVAPSRLREIAAWLERTNQPLPAFLMPKASLAPGGVLSFSYIDQRCSALGDYCRGADPSAKEMTAVTAALVNHIASRTRARVYLLHFAGAADKSLYAQLDPKVGVISAVHGSADSVVQDDIMGLDGHPGPYWHYAISRRLLAAIPWQGP